MNSHPLSLYEIVLAIGQFIPLWESVHSLDDDLWLFTPKDLLAAISVNRLFHATLTPLLWSVYVECAVKSLRDPNEFLCPEEYDIPFDVVKKYSSYIRILDLSSHWTQNLTRKELKDFESILSLRRLRYLSLENWNFLTSHLYRVLAKNADHLEELRLTCCNSIVHKRSKREDTGKSQITFTTSMETGAEEFETMNRRCGRIRLAKLKTLHLDVERFSCPQTLYWLIDVAPALETVVFRELLGSTAKGLSLILRKSCPRLQTIKQGDFWYVNEDIWRRPHKRANTALHLANACAPGHLAHASLDGWRIDNTYMEALSVHRDSLETLELVIRNNNYRDSFKNLSTILERCSRLKHMAVYFERHRVLYDHRISLLFLNKLATCPSLESLGFHGFTLRDDDNHLRESGDDYGSDEGTLRVRIDDEEEFDDYDPEVNRFYGPGWRQLVLQGAGADEYAGRNSAVTRTSIVQPSTLHPPSLTLSSLTASVLIIVSNVVQRRQFSLLLM
ncbi:MAG: hypothetical protein JOS17DRAFT_791378 [Linnemannia elongata]|nr:MAG: hypothetical protein JOS17DRAFT_791378 [Linnemannia elongata]